MNVGSGTKGIHGSRLDDQIIETIPVHESLMIEPLQHVLDISGSKELQRPDEPIVVESTRSTVEMAILGPVGILDTAPSDDARVIVKYLLNGIHLIAAQTIGIPVIMLGHESEQIIWNWRMQKRFFIHSHNVPILRPRDAIDFIKIIPHANRIPANPGVGKGVRFECYEYMN